MEAISTARAMRSTLTMYTLTTSALPATPNPQGYGDSARTGRTPIGLLVDVEPHPAVTARSTTDAVTVRPPATAARCQWGCRRIIRAGTRSPRTADIRHTVQQQVFVAVGVAGVHRLPGIAVHVSRLTSGGGQGIARNLHRGRGTRTAPDAHGDRRSRRPR